MRWYPAFFTESAMAWKTTGRQAQHFRAVVLVGAVCKLDSCMHVCMSQAVGTIKSPPPVGVHVGMEAIFRVSRDQQGTFEAESQ